jgi:hypothetical protein
MTLQQFQSGQSSQANYKLEKTSFIQISQATTVAELWEDSFASSKVSDLLGHLLDLIVNIRCSIASNTPGFKKRKAAKPNEIQEFTLKVTPGLPQSELDKVGFFPDWTLRTEWRVKKGPASPNIW